MIPPLNTVAVARMVRDHGALVPDGIFVPVMLRGRDALDLLHRISTNDLRLCATGTSVPTVFTTEKGRIIDWVEVVVVGDAVCLVAHRAAVDKLRDWITRYIISEDVEVDAATDSHQVASLLAGDIVSTVGRGSIEALTGIHGEWESAFGRFVMRRFLVPAAEKPVFALSMQHAGIRSLAPDEYTALRVAAGIPSYPEELNDRHNPLEAGLRASVSFAKGCYIGQEVISRLDSYDKVQRELVLLAVDAGGAEIAPEAEISASATMIGMVTSTGGSRGERGEVMVLGYVEKGIGESKGTLSVRTSSGPKAAALISVSGNPGSMPA